MKKVIALVAAVMCLLCVFAVAEAEGFTGTWINGYGTGIYEFKDDGTAAYYDINSGVFTAATWTRDNDAYIYSAASINGNINMYLYYDSASDMVTNLISLDLTRISDEEFEAKKADIASRSAIDVTMDDFCGKWTLSSAVSIANPEEVWGKDDHYIVIDFTINENGFTMNPDSYAMGTGFGSLTNAACGVYGNRLQIDVNGFSVLYAQMMSDGTIYLRGSSMVHPVFEYFKLYLEKAE